jgi:hypothetical protein
MVTLLMASMMVCADLMILAWQPSSGQAGAVLAVGEELAPVVVVVAGAGGGNCAHSPCRRLKTRTSVPLVAGS